ncbi:ferrous iron transport protein B [Megamonas funiformis]|uniref:Ferrous iron transport protein B n=1 Tax=Megamonas funiformis TaxID=437897 RepID=A0AAW4U2Y2_9FIRM|nr:ferrous iron transport protein B [Megamonas funiformis]
MPDVLDRSYEKDIIKQKYDFIEEIIQEVLVNKDKEARSTDRIDAVLTDNVWGIPIFLAIMAFIFFLTFTIGDIFKNYLVEGIDIVSNDLMAILNSIDVSPIISSLLIDGAIAGIGGILLAFLPNIFILFLALAVLEDSGYMSRVAYVMDSVMGKIGLSGRAFIPLLLGFGCSVPAIMASRALEDPKDRLRTILVTPFMSCSARLPIYILFSGMFFPEYAMFVAFSMYVIGIVMAIIIAKIFYKVSDKSDKKVLLIELPEYKSPNVMSIFLYAWEKVKSYLAKAGTTIFVASIIIWFILNFNFSGMVDIGDSFGAQIGRLIAPILVPAGLGLWQIAVALISGIAAKEVVVASLSVLYGILNINSAEGMNNLVGQLAQVGFHELNAYVLMVFCLLYTPCIASIVTIKKETNSTKWTCFAIFFQLLIAYLVAVIIYQVGSNILY